jgi:multiple sugar transport system substrate-binding protein
MKERIRVWKRIALALAFVMCFAACGSGTEPPQTSQEHKVEVGFTPRLDPETEAAVKVVGHYSNFEALEQEFNRFSRYYPNVEMVYTALDDYKNIISTALNSSEAPDIYFTYSSWTDENYAEAENLADPELGIDLSCIRSSLLYKDARGNVPTVPVYTTTYGMLVNESIFEKENIRIPETYDELLSACEALKAAGYASPVMGYNKGSDLLFPLFYPYFCAQIRENEAALKKLNDMEAGAGECVRGALELTADFMNRGYVDLDSCNQLENDYNAVIMRFFEGDVPMMMASANTVSGTEKRESQSEAFTAHPFRYSYCPVPSTEKGGYFLNSVSIGFAVNRHSANLDMANEFMRFLVTTDELNLMAQTKRMVTPCADMSLDGVYASFGKIDEQRIINLSELGIADLSDTQVRKAGWLVSNGKMTVDEAIAAFGTLN